MSNGDRSTAEEVRDIARSAFDLSEEAAPPPFTFADYQTYTPTGAPWFLSLLPDDYEWLTYAEYPVSLSPDDLHPVVMVPRLKTALEKLEKFQRLTPDEAEVLNVVLGYSHVMPESTRAVAETTMESVGWLAEGLVERADTPTTRPGMPGPLRYEIPGVPGGAAPGATLMGRFVASPQYQATLESGLGSMEEREGVDFTSIPDDFQSVIDLQQSLFPGTPTPLDMLRSYLPGGPNLLQNLDPGMGWVWTNWLTQNRARLLKETGQPYEDFVAEKRAWAMNEWRKNDLLADYRTDEADAIWAAYDPTIDGLPLMIGNTQHSVTTDGISLDQLTNGLSVFAHPDKLKKIWDAFNAEGHRDLLLIPGWGGNPLSHTDYLLFEKWLVEANKAGLPHRRMVDLIANEFDLVQFQHSPFGAQGQLGIYSGGAFYSTREVLAAQSQYWANGSLILSDSMMQTIGMSQINRDWKEVHAMLMAATNRGQAITGWSPDAIRLYTKLLVEKFDQYMDRYDQNPIMATIAVLRGAEYADQITRDGLPPLSDAAVLADQLGQGWGAHLTQDLGYTGSRWLQVVNNLRTVGQTVSGYDPVALREQTTAVFNQFLFRDPTEAELAAFLRLPAVAIQEQAKRMGLWFGSPVDMSNLEAVEDPTGLGYAFAPSIEARMNELLRQMAGYQTLYKHKPTSQTEAQYIEGFEGYGRGLLGFLPPEHAVKAGMITGRMQPVYQSILFDEETMRDSSNFRGRLARLSQVKGLLP